MPAMNSVFLAGNLADEVQTRTLPSGSVTATLRLAVSDDYTNKQGEKVERTVFLDVETWDRLAENCAKSLHKGSGVLVEGRLHLDSWTTKEGEKRSKLKVRAIRVQFLDRAPAGETEAGEQEKPPAESDDASMDKDIPF